MAKEIELSDGKKVTMRVPKVKDLRVLKHIKDEEEREIKLIANLTMMTDEEVDDLDLKDYKTLQEGLGGFLS